MTSDPRSFVCLGYLFNFARESLTKFPTVGEKIQNIEVKNLKKAKNPQMSTNLKRLTVFFRQLEQTNDEILLGMKSTFRNQLHADFLAKKLGLFCYYSIN